MSKRFGIIYKATSSSGKFYIGKTINKFSTRINAHFHSALNPLSTSYHTKFSKSIRKYGKNSFKWEILYKDIPENMLDIAEMCAIYTYDSYTSGYNSTFGGEGASGFVSSKETRQKISLKNKGKKRTQEHIEKIKLANTGIKRSEQFKQNLSINNCRYWKGKKHTQEYKLNMSKRTSGTNNHFYGKHHTLESRNKMKINVHSLSGKDNPNSTTYIIKNKEQEIKCCTRKELEIICKLKNISFSSLVKYKKYKNYILIKIKNYLLY